MNNTGGLAFILLTITLIVGITACDQLIGVLTEEELSQTVFPAPASIDRYQRRDIHRASLPDDWKARGDRSTDETGI